MMLEESLYPFAASKELSRSPSSSIRCNVSCYGLLDAVENKFKLAGFVAIAPTRWTNAVIREEVEVFVYVDVTIADIASGNRNQST